MKTTTGKRLLSLALSICMVLSLAPAVTLTASAAEGFADVPEGIWYAEAVDYVASRGYFNGTGANTFSPNMSMNRAMFVTVLARIDGFDTSDEAFNAAATVFTDVPSGRWYTGAVAWANENGIVQGVTPTTFSPTASVTREQMATFMVRYLSYYAEKNAVTFPEGESAAAFTDAASVSAYAVEAVARCRALGLINGFEDGSFGPAKSSIRAQVAVVIERLGALLASATAVTPTTGGGGSSATPATSVTTEGQIVAEATAQKPVINLKVATGHELTVNSTLNIVNDYEGLRTLTIDLGTAKVSAISIKAAHAETIVITGGEEAAASKLTVDAPLASVTNRLTVTGEVKIKDVSNHTFLNFAKTGPITMAGTGALNDMQDEPAPVTVTGTEVAIRGNSSEINVASDNAVLTVATATAPVINTTGTGVALTIATDQRTTINGNVDKVTTDTAQPKLAVTGTVNTVENTGNTRLLTLEGGGTVASLKTEGAAVAVSESAASANLTIATATLTGGSLSAPANVVGDVVASGSVTLAASAASVTTQGETALNVAPTAVIQNLTIDAAASVAGEGTVAKLEVTTTGSGSQTVVIPTSLNVNAVFSTGEGTVELEDENSDAVTTLTVTKKAAKPTTVTFKMATSSTGTATITGVSTAMEYLDPAAGTWQTFTGISLTGLTAGTYQVRVKEDTANKVLASEPVILNIPAFVGVTSASISGTPYVGQTLTASANSDATVNSDSPLSYQWYAGSDPINGAIGKTLVLTDGQIDKAITVAIWNSGTNAGTNPDWKKSTATAAITVDKTDLVRLIAKAAEVQQGVTVKADGTLPAAVPNGIIFIFNTLSGNLVSAVATANSANVDAANTNTVNAAISGLNAAINDYVEGKQVGTDVGQAALKEALGTLIASAEQARVATVKPNDTAATAVAPGTKWVTTAVQTVYNSAISAAQGKVSSIDVTELSRAIEALNAAMSTYRQAIREGAPLDGSALLAAIASAEQNAASVKISTDGSDVLPSEYWMTETYKTTYTAAITAAQNAKITVQDDYAAAIATLASATSTFNGRKKIGTKDIIAPTITIVQVTHVEGTTEEDTAYDIQFSSNEAVPAVGYQHRLSTANDWTTVAGAHAANAVITLRVVTGTAQTDLVLQVRDAANNTTSIGIPVKPVEPKVAAIGTQTYPTLAEAITAATAGQTVKLLQSTTVTETITINKNLILDLGGKTLTSSAQYAVVSTAGTLTVRNGTIEETAAGSTVLHAKGGTVIVDNGAILKGIGTGLRIGQSAVLADNNSFGGVATVKAGATITGANVGVFVAGPYATSDHANGLIGSETLRSTLNVEGGSISAVTYAIVGNGAQLGTVINISGGTITQTRTDPDPTLSGSAIYHPQGGVLNISGNPVITGDDGIQLCSGDAVITTITGGIITGTNADVRDQKTRQDGILPDGAALSIVDRGYPGGTPKMTITGGTFISQQSQAVMAYTWNVANTPQSSTWDGADDYLVITGGTFSSSPAAYVPADTHTVTGTAAAGYTVAPWSAATAAAQVGSGYYGTFDAAVAAAPSGSTVRLLRDATLDTSVTVDAGDSLTVDLSGNTLSTTIAGAFRNYGTLTFRDSASGGKLVQNNTGGYIVFTRGGVVNIESGAYETNGAYGAVFAGAAGYTGSVINVTGGTITTTGGRPTFQLTYDTTLNYRNATTLSDGIVISASNTMPTANANIYSGSMTSTQYAAIYFPAQGVLNISGGTITGETALDVRMGQITISGGTLRGTKNEATAANKYEQYYGFNGCAVNGSAILMQTGKYDVGAEPYGNSLDLTITGGTLISDYGYALDIRAHNKFEQTVNVTVTGGTITAAAGKDVIYAPNLTGTVTNQYDSQTGRFDKTYTFGTVANIKNIAVTGGTFSSNPTVYVDGSAFSVVQDGEAYIVRSLASANAVASVGGQRYGTLQAAVNAATDGSTITMLRDSAGEGILITEGRTLTIDLGGHTYLIEAKTVGSKGTETNGFQLKKGANVTIKNGEITSTLAKILIQNYCNLTLEDVTLDARGEGTRSQYVLSNNFGDVQIKGDTSIYAPDGSIAMDVSWWPRGAEGVGVYSAGSKVNVNTTGDIVGNLSLGVWGPLTEGQREPAGVNTKLTIENGNFDGSLTYEFGTGGYDTGCTDAQKEAIKKAMCTVTGGTFSDLSGLPYLAEGKTYTLSEDATVPATWTSVGTAAAPFKGTLDGGGHTITTASMLFNVAADAIFKDFTIAANIADARAALVYQATDCRFEDITLSGSVTSINHPSSGESGQCGGLVWAAMHTAEAEPFVFDNIDVSATVTAKGARSYNTAGLIVAQIESAEGQGDVGSDKACFQFIDCDLTGTVSVEAAGTKESWGGKLFGNTAYDGINATGFAVTVKNCSTGDATFTKTGTNIGTNAKEDPMQLGRVDQMSTVYYLSATGNQVTTHNTLTWQTMPVQLGNTYYATLQAAVNAAGSGDTVKLLCDAGGDGVVAAEGSSFTLDLGGHTYEITGQLVGSASTPTNGFQLLKNSDITITNGTLKSTKAKILIQNYCNLVLSDITLDCTGGGAGNKTQYVLSNNCGVSTVGTVELSGSTSITAPEGAVAIDVSWWPGRYPAGAQVTLNTTGTVTGSISLGVWGPLTDEQRVPENVMSRLAIQNVNLVGSIITEFGTGGYDTGCDEEQQAAIAKIMCTVTGGTFSSDPADYVAEGYTATEDEGSWTVAAGGSISAFGEEPEQEIPDATKPEDMQEPGKDGDGTDGDPTDDGETPAE